jgi:hypothetical protein
VADDFSERYGDLLTGSYDCVDRIVLNAFFPLGHNPGGFRTWWRRLHDGSDDLLDDTHLMRFAGRFARRLKAWAGANGVPVIYCKAGQRKHLIAEEYLASHQVGTGVFLVLAAKAPAPVREVRRSQSTGVIGNIAKKTTYVSHYSFHIMDPQWGHVTIKMSGHPPLPAQVILNGHEHVAAAARAAGIGFAKEGNCFTEIADPQGLARVADALSQHAAAGPWARSATGGSTPRACAPAWTWPSRPAAVSATPTPSTRPSTAATCCSAPALRWRTCSTGSWTGPGPGWTSPPCGPCSASGNGLTRTGRPDRPRRRS